MSIKFEWDEQGFKREMEQWANEAVRNIVAEAQPKLDAVFNAHQGHAVDEVTPPLRATFTEMGWTMTEDELRTYAEAISGGQHRAPAGGCRSLGAAGGIDYGVLK